MRFTTAIAAAGSLVLSHVAHAAHGDGDEGSIMGPVAFLWPPNRPWNAAFDNIGPCGSQFGVSNRTKYPLSQGSVALSIADDAYQIAFYVAFDNNPTTQSQFQEQVVNNVTEVEPGHQCYKIDPIPSTVKAGTNATIQLEYWAKYGNENGGKNESFYACADITFVEDEDFNEQAICFNVTVPGFDGDPTSTTGIGAPAATATNAPSTSSPDETKKSSSSGLSGGAKAGIAVGSIVGAIAIGVVALLVYRRKRRTGYLERRRASKLNDPIPLNKRNVDGTSFTSH
ncbi:hypothetical protein SPI_02658 [Niveomyces insectorum RCEF 264]|uniref:Copper acquisition factor BIM1-like domain-containing protein n=1 Tax=Niveomyces insectorum RCEF 264 TaxID=1081102 RepID=A0A167Y5K6_9HYPO|nr:hypothetical protein SPI_02658 [Niveomyces insectorum RCEF 264]